MTSTSSVTSRISHVFSSVVFAAALGLAACTGGESTASLTPSAIGIVSGNGQSAVAGAVLANPFLVEVLDQNAEGMGGVTVTWTIVTGGGSLTSAASVTDSPGHASTRYTAGPVAGTATVRAAVSGIPNPVIFTITITPGSAS